MTGREEARNEVNANDANPGLHELIQELTQGGYRFDLRPTGGMDDGTTREVYYAVLVRLDGLLTAQLKHLLAVVDGSPYEGRITKGELVLEAHRR